MICTPSSPSSRPTESPSRKSRSSTTAALRESVIPTTTASSFTSLPRGWVPDLGFDARRADPPLLTAPIICPVCGGSNAADAVFCANPVCHKALGEFRYVTEEIKRETRPHERIADSVTSFIGRPHFLVVHTVWFALWVAINTGFFMIAGRFDEYPFS